MLRKVRTSEGLTIAELARLSEVNERTIRDIEKGTRQGTEVTGNKILRGLNDNPKNSQLWKYEGVFGY